MHRSIIRIPSILLIGLLIVRAPALLSAEPSGLPAPEPQVFREWQVLEVKTGRPVAFDEWIAALAGHDVIYLGEEHRNRSHVAAALRILEAFLARGRRPALALEMFGWDGQAGLDRYLSNRDMAREQFLGEARWEQNWGGPFDDYEPLINFARGHGVPVLALNPPRPLVRQVAAQGLAQALTDPVMNRWGLWNDLLVDDRPYREMILRQLRLCHKGLSEDGYQRMYEASMFRDEGMAKTISGYLQRARPGEGPVVSYTGGGHIQHRLPVPNRVLRRRNAAVKQTTVYLTALAPNLAPDIQELVRETIAEYLWLTPLSAHGAPRRCR